MYDGCNYNMVRYGMGVAYSKMGKHDLALIHVKEAHRLNSSNSVLLYNVGTVCTLLQAPLYCLRQGPPTDVR